MRTLLIPPAFIAVYGAVLVGLTVLTSPGAWNDQSAGLERVRASTLAGQHLIGRVVPGWIGVEDEEGEPAEAPRGRY